MSSRMGVAVFFFAVAVSLFGARFLGTADEQQAVSVWLPAGAEVISSGRVQEGTFKIEEPLADFQQKSKGAKVIVTYANGEPATITYWRVEGPVFYYAPVEIPSQPRSGWDRSLSLDGQAGELAFDDGAFFVKPGVTLFVMVGAFVSAFIGMALTAYDG